MRKLIPFLFVMLVFASCGNSYKENQRISRAERARIDSIDRASFKIGVLPTLDCLPIYVAYSENLFDTLGVEVHIKPFTAQMDCDTALIGGSVEGSITDLIRARHLQEQGVGLDCSISTNTYWQLITNRLSRIKSLDQLSDKMIAITRNSATDYLADIAIKRGKPKYDCYRIQINDVNIRLAMLRNNEMDAMLLTEPQTTTARLLKNPVLLDSRDLKENLGAFAFRTKIYRDKRRREQYRKFIKAYNMACDSINKNGAQHYATLISKYMGADERTIKALPKLRFQHASRPTRN